MRTHLALAMTLAAAALATACEFFDGSSDTLDASSPASDTRDSDDDAAPGLGPRDYALYSGLRWARSEGTECRLNDCLATGWSLASPFGTVTVDCRLGNCTTDGWRTSFPDGVTVDVDCIFGDCLRDGWRARLPDGQSAESHCRFASCATDGWTTTVTGAAAIDCTCVFNNCAEDGVRCN